MRALILLHRWLGVPFSLLFAMWFATGIVMHFVPFPTLTEAERVGGLRRIDISRVMHGPADAVMASMISGITHVRLLERDDGPIFLLSGAFGVSALHATDLSDARVSSEQLALAIAVDHARERGLPTAQAKFVELTFYDQWTVPNDLDVHRPLYRIALNDEAETELYVSSTTGEVVRDTNQRERWWNYTGSVAHWIYFTALRRNWAAWDRLVWWLSLIALITAVSGAVLGPLSIKVERHRIRSPYRGWHAWHHWLGLLCMTFVITWIFSGWLSMDHGRLFSTGQLSEVELAIVDRLLPLGAFSEGELLQRISAPAKEIEWFAFGGRAYLRERLGLDTQRLFIAGSNAAAAAPEREFLSPEEASGVADQLASGCKPAAVVGTIDDYPITATMPNAPVYRSICRDTWVQIDGANGAFLERLDASRRAYRWAYGALHTLDFPALTMRPNLRTALIVTLCVGGLAFSLSGVVIGWRRLRLYTDVLRHTDVLRRGK